MRDRDYKIIFVKSHNGGYTAWVHELDGIIVEVDKKEDAPKELATLFKVILEYMFETGNHQEYSEDDIITPQNK